MSGKSISPAQSIPHLFSFKWLLVIFALADLILTIIRVSTFYDEALANEVNVENRMFYFFAFPFLLLVACVGIRLNNKWSYLLSISASVWLMKMTIAQWLDNADWYGHPMFSWSAISSWWNYANLSKWNLIRLPFAVFVLCYATVLLWTSIRRPHNRIKPIPIQ